MKKEIREIMIALAEIETLEDAGRVTGMIDRAFETEKIRFADHEALIDVVGRMMNLLNL